MTTAELVLELVLSPRSAPRFAMIVLFPVCETSRPRAYICPASRASWMVCSVLIMLIPIAPVPSSIGTSTSMLKANSMLDTPRVATRFIFVLLWCGPDARWCPRRFDQVGGGDGNRHRALIRRLVELE